MSEGWDQSSYTLTVTDSTPTTLYPHCGVHTGMYTNGRIEIVTTFDESLIDVHLQVVVWKSVEQFP